MDSTAVLRTVPLFSNLDEESLRILARRGRRRRFPPNYALFCQGDPGHTLYVVISGRVRIERVTPEGDRVHLSHRKSGEMFGEMAAIDGEPRMADATTAEDCDLLMLDRDDFMQCLRQSSEIGLAVISCLCDRLREAADLLEALLSRDVLGRVCAALLELMELHGIPESDGSVRIDARLTQRALAEQLGTTRESVNRALSSLKGVKAIRRDGRQLVVLNPGKLRDYIRR